VRWLSARAQFSARSPLGRHALLDGAHAELPEPVARQVDVIGVDRDDERSDRPGRRVIAQSSRRSSVRYRAILSTYVLGSSRIVGVVPRKCNVDDLLSEKRPRQLQRPLDHEKQE
jgi:hypothetical protein